MVITFPDRSHHLSAGSVSMSFVSSSTWVLYNSSQAANPLAGYTVLWHWGCPCDLQLNDWLLLTDFWSQGSVLSNPLGSMSILLLFITVSLVVHIWLSYMDQCYFIPSWRCWRLGLLAVSTSLKESKPAGRTTPFEEVFASHMTWQSIHNMYGSARVR